MKRMVLLVLVGLCVGLAGCSGVACDARHSALIDLTAATAETVSYKANLVDACKDMTQTPPVDLPPCDCVGEFTKAEIKAQLKDNAAVWSYFQQAKNGVQGEFPVGIGE